MPNPTTAYQKIDRNIKSGCTVNRKIAFREQLNRTLLYGNRPRGKISLQLDHKTPRLNPETAEKRGAKGEIEARDKN
jgi:hypothetical protein